MIKKPIILLISIFLVSCSHKTNQNIPVINASENYSNNGPLQNKINQNNIDEVMNQNNAENIMTVFNGFDEDRVLTVNTLPIENVYNTPSNTENHNTFMIENSYNLAPKGQSPYTAIEKQSTKKENVLSQPVLSLINKSKDEEERGRYDNAAATLEQALRISPQEPQVLYHLAQIRLIQGDIVQAGQIAKQATSLISGETTLKKELQKLINQIDP